MNIFLRKIEHEVRKIILIGRTICYYFVIFNKFQWVIYIKYDRGYESNSAPSFNEQIQGFHKLRVGTIFYLLILLNLVLTAISQCRNILVSIPRLA